jgi:hypothetical protein
MNSLYGRFGMNPVAEESCIVSAEESEKIIMERKNVKMTDPSRTTFALFSLFFPPSSSPICSPVAEHLEHAKILESISRQYW